MSEPTRYEYSNGNNYWGHFINPKTQHFAPYGEYVRYEDYARLKAEVEKLKANDSIIIQAQASAGKSVVHYLAEIESLKSEVERLTAFTTRTIIPNEELQAQVERLTKAGDALAKEAIRLEYSNYWSEYEKVEDVCIDEVEAWHKAKGAAS